MGRKTHASQHDIWSDLRSLAYFGLCDSQRKLADLDAAIMNCQKSLTYGPKDPYAHYALGLAFMYKANKTGSIAELQPALQHLQKTIEINPDFSEAQLARQNIANIQKALSQ
jgi:tetratricopeptide (TPR) repeat protein